MTFYRIDKLGLRHLSSGLDELDGTEVQKKFPRNIPGIKPRTNHFFLEIPPKRRTAGDHSSAMDLQKTQINDTGINQVLTWVREQSRPPRSHLHGLPRAVWKLWELFDEPTNRHGILCRKHEILKTSQMVPPPNPFILI